MKQSKPRKKSRPRTKSLTGLSARLLLLAELDPGIRSYVETLMLGGIETFESCQGGAGHAYREPTVRFHGERPEGFKALSIAQYHAMPVAALRRVAADAIGALIEAMMLAARQAPPSLSQEETA